MKKYFILLVLLGLALPLWADNEFKQPFNSDKGEPIENIDMEYPSAGEWVGPLFGSFDESAIHKSSMRVKKSEVYAWLRQGSLDSQNVHHSSVSKVYIDCSERKISKPLTLYTWNSSNQQKVQTETTQYFSEMYTEGGFRSDEKLVINEVCKLIAANRIEYNYVYPRGFRHHTKPNGQHSQW